MLKVVLLVTLALSVKALPYNVIRDYDDDSTERSSEELAGLGDDDATEFFTEVLNGFPEVQRSGYPNMSLVAVDPYTFVDSTTYQIRNLTFTFSQGIISGMSSGQLSEISVSTPDNYNYDVDYVWETGQWVYTSQYTCTGTAKGEIIDVSGEFIMTAQMNYRRFWLTLFKNSNVYTLHNFEDRDTLNGAEMIFTGLPSSAKSVIESRYNYLVKQFWYMIIDVYIADEYALLKQDILSSSSQ
jgi:hypothetical protein